MVAIIKRPSLTLLLFLAMPLGGGVLLMKCVYISYDYVYIFIYKYVEVYCGSMGSKAGHLGVVRNVIFI